MSAEIMPGDRKPRRSLAVGIAAAAVAVPIAAYSLTADHSNAARPAKIAASQATATGTDFHAYVAAIGNLVAEFDTASGTLLALVSVRDSIGSTVLDSPVSIAATPDGSQVFTADEGKSSVLAIATANNAPTEIELGGGPPPGTTTVPLPPQRAQQRRLSTRRSRVARRLHRVRDGNWPS